MFDILVLNLNCLDHTKNIIKDLYNQTYKKFDLTLIDQGSIESGTKEYLEELRELYSNIKIIENNKNAFVNRTWNNFVEKSEKEFFCILNNDIRIPKTFLKSAIDIFSKERGVGAILHPTNHPDYDQAYNKLFYKILPKGKYRQGWDICMRKKAWTPIPEMLKIYCGDDFVFENMYAKGYDCAIDFSSPIIHFVGQTRKSRYNLHMPERNPKKDIENYRALGYKHHMIPPLEYTIVDYTQSPIEFIKE